MTPVLPPAINAEGFFMALRMPAEHGSWGILIIPFITAAKLAGNWNVPVMLTAICMFSFFLLRGSMAAEGGWKTIRTREHLILLATGATTAALLVFEYRLFELLILGYAAGVLYLLQRLLMRNQSRERREKRSLWAELIGVAVLSSSAPAAWIAARGRLDAAGVQVWMLNVLFFAGGVLYVKYRIRGIAVHRPFSSVADRAAFVWPVLLFHLSMLAFVVALVRLNSVPLALVFAFVPAVFRSAGLLFHLGQRFAIRRLGWTEVAQSVTFAVLLVAFYR